MSKAFTAEFKIETGKLVFDQNYTQEEAAKAMNVSRSAIGRWVRSLCLERQGKTSPGFPLIPERIEFKGIKKRIQCLEMENEILQKATALLMSDSLNGRQTQGTITGYIAVATANGIAAPMSPMRNVPLNAVW